MTYQAPATKTLRGQVKCFKCRKVSALKEGKWCNEGNQQVFLCKPCERESAAQAKGKPVE